MIHEPGHHWQPRTFAINTHIEAAPNAWIQLEQQCLPSRLGQHCVCMQKEQYIPTGFFSTRVHLLRPPLVALDGKHLRVFGQSL